MINIENHHELLTFLLEQKLSHHLDGLDFTNLHGGVSNRTVLIQKPDGNGWVVKQALEKLRVKEDWYSKPERIHHEANGIRELAFLTPEGSIPKFIYENKAQHILIMEAVPEPHTNYKTLLLKQPPEQKHCQDFANLLADIHLNSYNNKHDLSLIFQDTSFFENLRLDPYYAFSARQLPDAAPFLNHLIQKTRLRKRTLVHGDYSPKNILIYQDKLVLLDHEVIHFGDPAFDVGFAMAHFLSKAHYLISSRHLFFNLAEIFWKTYFNRTGSAVWADELETYCQQHLLACLLARAIGKSPLEYLDEKLRETQKSIVLSMIKENIHSIPTLINTFREQLKSHEHD